MMVRAEEKQHEKKRRKSGQDYFILACQQIPLEMSKNVGMTMIDETFKKNQQFLTVDTYEEIRIIMQLGRRKPAEMFTAFSLNLPIGIKSTFCLQSTS